jgi:uncharacterized protein YjbJ (UPF0337 family)
MNKDRVKGIWNETKGKIKEEVGHAIGDGTMENEGLRSRIQGRFEKRLANVKDSVKKGVDILLKKV